MLFLCYPQHNEFSLSDPLSRFIIPGRHGLTTTSSPGGKVDQQDFPAAKLRQRYGLAIRDCRQYKIRMRLTHARRIASRISRAGDSTNAAASQRQQVQVLHYRDPQRRFSIPAFVGTSFRLHISYHDYSRRQLCSCSFFIVVCCGLRRGCILGTVRLL